MSNKIIRFKRLFKSLDEVGEVKLMKSILKYLCEMKYSVSNEGILAIFNTLSPTTVHINSQSNACLSVMSLG